MFMIITDKVTKVYSVTAMCSDFSFNLEAHRKQNVNFVEKITWNKSLKCHIIEVLTLILLFVVCPYSALTRLLQSSYSGDKKNPD